MLSDMQKAVSERGVSFTYDDKLIDYLVEKSFSIKYGARNLRRLIQKEVEDAAASLLISRYKEHITQVAATVRDGKVELSAM
jgi:ATP-dependent Clp protease ATP-binding subunit ClpA